MTLAKREEWKHIPGFHGYFASNLGRIKSVSQGHKKVDFILKPCPVANGYWRVTLYKNKRGTPMKVHTIVALTFFGERPDGYHIEHIDHDKSNNAPSNLRYCTPQENYARGQRDGVYLSGENHPSRKLTITKVAKIRSSRSTPKELAKKYNVDPGTIRSILRGDTWRVSFNSDETGVGL